MTCARFRSPFSLPPGSGVDQPFCAAFPGGIPDDVFRNRFDHRQPIAGDHGVRWESDGHAFPEGAFPAERLGVGKP